MNKDRQDRQDRQGEQGPQGEQGSEAPQSEQGEEPQEPSPITSGTITQLTDNFATTPRSSVLVARRPTHRIRPLTAPQTLGHLCHGCRRKKTITQITEHSNDADFHPAWSPDGQRIAFASDRDADSCHPTLRFMSWMPTEKTSPKSQNNYDATDWNPSWSPDGQRIAFDLHPRRRQRLRL